MGREWGHGKVTNVISRVIERGGKTNHSVVGLRITTGAKGTHYHTHRHTPTLSESAFCTNQHKCTNHP